MMANRLEELWQSASDGASTPVGQVTSHIEADFDELLHAWFLERRNSIEFEILLDESRKMIARLIAEGEVSDSSRRRAGRLMKAIDRTLRASETEPDADDA